MVYTTPSEKEKEEMTPNDSTTNTTGPDAAPVAPPPATAPIAPTPVLAGLKTALAAKDKALADLQAKTASDAAQAKANADSTVADLQARLDAATANGAALAGKISAQADTIDTLHEQLAEYNAIKTFLGAL